MPRETSAQSGMYSRLHVVSWLCSTCLCTGGAMLVTGRYRCLSCTGRRRGRLQLAWSRVAIRARCVQGGLRARDGGVAVCRFREWIIPSEWGVAQRARGVDRRITIRTWWEQIGALRPSVPWRIEICTVSTRRVQPHILARTCILSRIDGVVALCRTFMSTKWLHLSAATNF